MSTYAPKPKLRRGAFVTLSAMGVPLNTLVFQYNPEQMSRSITPRNASENAAPESANTLSGTPQESLSLTIEFDATDALEEGDAIAQRLGVHPQLAALECLLYPDSKIVLANEVLLKFGVREISSTERPLTLLVWGTRRILPVRLGSFTINETFYDGELNPIHASVEISLSVLTYDDLPSGSQGRFLFQKHHIQKEALGALSTGRSALDLLNLSNG